MSRPKGSRNKAPTTIKSVAVRLTKAELAILRTIAKSPSKAIKTLIAERKEPKRATGTDGTCRRSTFGCE